MNRLALQDECLRYFHQCSVWHKVLTGFHDKYSSYGRLGGKVVLKNLKPEEIDTLEGFFCRSFHGQKSVTVSADAFCRALKASRFGGLEPERILEQFVGAPLVGKQERRDRFEEEKNAVRERIKVTLDGTPAREIVDMLCELIKVSEGQSLDIWEERLLLGGHMYNQLPFRMGEMQYLAVFAAKVTGNPHAFDRGSTEGALLEQLVQISLKRRGIEVEADANFPAYQRQRCYLQAGILFDDVSNYAMLFQVQAIRQDGKVHSGMEGFAAEKQMVQVPLAVISGWREIRCIDQEIFIVENPSVYALLCNQDRNRSYMCMNGQPRLASLLVLDLLARSGTTVYYSGDLDPEGLLIAQKLFRHYDGAFHFWHMGAEDYEEAKSDEQLPERRLKMLDRIEAEELQETVQLLRTCRRAGYQERLKWN